MQSFTIIFIKKEYNFFKTNEKLISNNTVKNKYNTDFSLKYH